MLRSKCDGSKQIETSSHVSIQRAIIEVAFSKPEKQERFYDPVHGCILRRYHLHKFSTG